MTPYYNQQVEGYNVADADLVEEYVIVDYCDAEEIIEVSSRYKVQVAQAPSLGLEPVATVTLILIGTATAVATVAYLADQRKGGQVIDLRRGSPKSIYRSRDVVFGLVIVITDRGVVRVEVHEPKGMFGTVCESLTSSLPELTQASTDEVAGKIIESIGTEGISIAIEGSTAE